MSLFLSAVKAIPMVIMPIDNSTMCRVGIHGLSRGRCDLFADPLRGLNPGADGGKDKSR
jgi:hypothetical protein